MMLEWPTRLQEFLTQHELMQDHLLQFRDAMLAARTALERHIIVWCIQYYVPLRQFARGEIHLTFYEHLVARPQEEIPRLFQYLGKKFDDHVYTSLAAPSFVTNTESVVHTDRSGIIDSWTRRMSREDVAKSISILRLFGLDKIYGEDPFADIAAANDVLRGSLESPQRA
jgi:hypothetical protein